MCTSITLQSRKRENFFGRTMDFSYDIEPQLYIIPNNYVWENSVTMNKFQNRYRFIGIGQESDGLLGFFDGVNECGFAAAALYFAGYAKYSTHTNCTNKQPVAAFDFLHYILGNCSSLKELAHILGGISIVGVPDPVTQTIAPLHWIATDRTGDCVVIEQTAAGLYVFQNSIGVLANSPDFPWHMTNLRNYMGVSQKQINEVKWGTVPLTPFGQGAGTMLLPGGYTSPERFVRTAYQKTHIETPKNGLDAVNACFQIMKSVSIPKGIVMTDRNTCDYTKYTAFMNTNTCEYFFNTYNNQQIATASLRDYDCYSTQPICLGTLMRPVVFQKLRDC